MRRIPPLNIVLFILTCLTTLMAGAMHLGANPFTDPVSLVLGIPYAATLMVILLVHELGHYFASRAHRVDATLPYFIPVPPQVFLFGTMGAVIRMRSPIMDRRALIDIGAMGPIAGFVLALMASGAGLAMSDIIAVPETGLYFSFGEPLAFSFLSRLIVGPLPEGMDVLLHPVAFAGWIGMFVTMLNLLPVGQLDGGHILYALLGQRHHRAGAAVVGILAIMGLYWEGWFIWAALLFVMGFRHPPVHVWEPRLDNRRRWVALASVVIFVLTFMPIPLSIN